MNTPRNKQKLNKAVNACLYSKVGVVRREAILWPCMCSLRLYRYIKLSTQLNPELLTHTLALSSEIAFGYDELLSFQVLWPLNHGLAHKHWRTRVPQWSVGYWFTGHMAVVVKRTSVGKGGKESVRSPGVNSYDINLDGCWFLTHNDSVMGFSSTLDGWHTETCVACG